MYDTYPADWLRIQTLQQPRVYFDTVENERMVDEALLDNVRKEMYSDIKTTLETSKLRAE